MTHSLPRLAAALMLAWGGLHAARAALVVPGADGSDEMLNIATDTVIDLSEAVDAAWDAPNNDHAGKGVYDANKWAVVFKYSGVNIAAGAKLTFINHPTHAPVVWLVNGDVTIAGTLSVSGQNGAVSPAQAEPGPGGFRGGMGYYSSGAGAGPGFGVGGGGFQSNIGFGGSYGTQGYTSPGFPSSVPYGNPSLVPLIGGSGGGGDGDNTAGGGGGGGAILIACTGTVTVSGALRADGGNLSANNAGGGSGGGIRIVADRFAGNGQVTAVGGNGYLASGAGRIRVERVISEGSAVFTPGPSVVGLASGTTALLWPPADAPTVRIVSIGGESVPNDPQASMGALGPDVAISQTASTQVIVETVNVEQASVVQVRATPRSGAQFATANATVSSVVADNPLTLRWTADLPVTLGHSAVQVKVVRP